MEALVLNPTSTAQWQSLVEEAVQSTGIALNEDLESYLVFLLMRFIEQPKLLESVLALEFLEGHQMGLSQRRKVLRDVGDKCLLFSGLFPGWAKRKRVRISYFVRLGRTAYGCLSDINELQHSDLYGSLQKGFVPMMDILHHTREMAADGWRLAPFDALDLWDDTQSQHALKVLQNIGSDLPFVRHISSRH